MVKRKRDEIKKIEKNGNQKQCRLQPNKHLVTHTNTCTGKFLKYYANVLACIDVCMCVLVVCCICAHGMSLQINIMRTHR